MDFGLSEEQDLLQETLRQFLGQECPPPRLHQIFDSGMGHDADLWKGLASLGLCGLMLPEIYGGAELEVLDLALVCEELGYGGMPGPFLTHSLAGLAIRSAGEESQQAHWLPRLADGSSVATLALGEDSGTSGAAGGDCRLDGDLLSGQVRFVPHGGIADVILVGLPDGRFALVERSARGIEIQSEEGIDRSRPIDRVSFRDTPCDVLSGNDSAEARVRDVGLVLLAADAFGCASRLIDLTVEYAKTREQFGRKIAEFQTVKHQLARLGLEVEPTRALFWYAAHALDHLEDEAPRAAAMAKAHITDRSIEVARAVVELHGGIGFTWECDVHLWFKRIMFDRAFLGSPDFLRERCASLGGL